jgi:hypothetical protein
MSRPVLSSELDRALRADALMAKLLLDAVSTRLSQAKEDFDAFLERSVTVHVNTFSSGVGKERLGGLFGFRCRRTVSYDGKLDMLLTDIKNYISSKYKIFLVCRTDAERENMRDFLSENGF